MNVTDPSASSRLRMTTRLAMLLIAYIPLLHVAGCIALCFLHVSFGLLALYAIPPLASRIGRFQPGTYANMHFGWWWSQQWQTLFNRFPQLEELLRLVPSLYSMWLRLWGSQIGRLVYWAPGVSILDRGLLRIGDSVVLGASVRIIGHLFTNDELLIAPVTIESSAVVSGYSILAPGVVIGENESTPASLLLPPHSEWRGEKRVVRRSKHAL